MRFARAGSAAAAMFAALAACQGGPTVHGAVTGTSSSASTGGSGSGGAAPTGGATGNGGAALVGSGGGLATGGGTTTCVPAQTSPAGDCASQGITLASPFAADYTCVDLGTLPAVPAPWGGFAMPAKDPTTLHVTGNARTAQGRLYSVSVGRNVDCHLTGFAGGFADIAEAPYNEAGVAYGPGGVLFLAQAVVNRLGELAPGSTTTSKLIDMGALGVAATMCGIVFVPTGFPGAGRLKLTNWPSPGHWYDAAYAKDAMGTYDITSVTPAVSLPNGVAGFVFIAGGNADFAKDTVLVSEYDTGTVVAYDLTATGDPDPTTRKVFLSGLTGAQGGVLDPVSGDFLFSTYSTARIIAVRGFQPPPPPLK
jgi:hypothetical protein